MSDTTTELRENTRNNDWRVAGALGLMLVSGICNGIAVLAGSPASVLIITHAFIMSTILFAAYVALSEDCKPAQVIEDINSSKIGEEESRKQKTVVR